MLVPKAALVRAPAYPPAAQRTTPTSQTLPCFLRSSRMRLRKVYYMSRVAQPSVSPNSLLAASFRPSRARLLGLQNSIAFWIMRGRCLKLQLSKKGLGGVAEGLETAQSAPRLQRSTCCWLQQRAVLGKRPAPGTLRLRRLWRAAGWQ